MIKPPESAINMSTQELASYIDYSVLKPEFTVDQVTGLIKESIQLGCRAVCVNPSVLKIALELTRGTGTLACVVCDFPFGQGTTEQRVFNAELLAKMGAKEIDIVANYGFIKSELWDEVYKDLKAVTGVCHRYKSEVKVIIETDAISVAQAKKATEIIISAGSDFVKTSTGFFTGGASKGGTPEIIGELLQAADGKCKVKASGGIRTQKHFFELIDLGVDRVGIGFASVKTVLGI